MFVTQFEPLVHCKVGFYVLMFDDWGMLFWFKIDFAMKYLNLLLKKVY